MPVLKLGPPLTDENSVLVNVVFDLRLGLLRTWIEEELKREKTRRGGPRAERLRLFEKGSQVARAQEDALLADSAAAATDAALRLQLWTEQLPLSLRRKVRLPRLAHLRQAGQKGGARAKRKAVESDQIRLAYQEHLAKNPTDRLAKIYEAVGRKVGLKPRTIRKRLLGCVTVPTQKGKQGESAGPAKGRSPARAIDPLRP